MTMLERDDKAAAAEALNEAAKLAPGMPGWLVVISSMLELAGAYDQAIANYREVLTIQPNNIVAMNNLAYALAVHRGSPADALPIIKKAAALAPAPAPSSTRSPGLSTCSATRTRRQRLLRTPFGSSRAILKSTCTRR